MNCRIAPYLATCLLVSLPMVRADEWTEIALTNPSFESGEGVPDGWTIYKGNTVRRSHPSVIAWDKEFARTGERSVFIRKEDSGPIRWRSQGSIPVTLGHTYRLECWVRSSGSGKYATATLTASSAVSGPDGKPWLVTKEFAAGDTPNPDWHRVSLEFTPPDWVKHFTISFANSMAARDGTAIEFWFDDLSLHEKSHAQAPTIAP